MMNAKACNESAYKLAARACFETRDWTLSLCILLEYLEELSGAATADCNTNVVNGPVKQIEYESEGETEPASAPSKDDDADAVRGTGKEQGSAFVALIVMNLVKERQVSPSTCDGAALMGSLCCCCCTAAEVCGAGSSSFERLRGATVSRLDGWGSAGDETRREEHSVEGVAASGNVPLFHVNSKAPKESKEEEAQHRNTIKELILVI